MRIETIVVLAMFAAVLAMVTAPVWVPLVKAGW